MPTRFRLKKVYHPTPFRIHLNFVFAYSNSRKQNFAIPNTNVKGSVDAPAYISPALYPNPGPWIVSNCTIPFRRWYRPG